MKEKNRGKKKSGGQRRQERRFIAEANYASQVSTAIGMVGSLLLGAGVWGQWVRDEPKSYALYLVLIGGAMLIASLWQSSRGANPIRVGDAGVALEQRSDLRRIPWYQMQSVSMKGEALCLSLEGTLGEVLIPLGAHPKAIAKIVQEAAVRIPARLELSPNQHQTLPKLNEYDGEVMPIDSLQIAGTKCLHCDQVIVLERDARLCPACGAVYNSGHVPQQCKSCGGSLGDRALSA
jgi:hypothetical protein